MRHLFGLGRLGAGRTRGFAHGDGITSHAVAGVGDEIAADAASGHHEAIDVMGDQSA